MNADLRIGGRSAYPHKPKKAAGVRLINKK